VYCHVIRWRETADDAAATRFERDLFAIAGDQQHPDRAQRITAERAGFVRSDGV
jgi:secreted PhoX family phosphatase